MTVTIPESNGHAQDAAHLLNKSASSFFTLDFENLNINPTVQEGVTPINSTPENVTQKNSPPKNALNYTKSNVILKPDDVVPPRSTSIMTESTTSIANTTASSNNDMPISTTTTNTASPVGTPKMSSNSPRLMDQQQHQPQLSPSFQNARVMNNPNNSNSNINGSPSFQNARPLQYSPSFNGGGAPLPPSPPQNGIPPLQQQRFYNNNNVSRQPSGYYSERPPPQQQQPQFHYRQGAPLPPQPMMSPQGTPMSPPQQFNNNFRPPPPPPNHTYRPNNNGYNPQMRPMVPPPQTPQMFGHNQSTTSLAPSIVDSSYLADSSLSVANAAGKRPKKSQFPPATKENLAMFRQEAQSTSDPRVLLDFAKFLLEAVHQLCVDEQDPKRTKKAREAMVMEAQKIVKKLATHSGMGKQGYPDAQFFLANCYGTGSMGLQTDPEKAFALYVQGSKQSHPGCTFRAAVCYEVGAGTKRDKNHAMQFYRKAANLGDSVAMYKLGMILLKGFLGQPKNPREGISWLKRASQQADEDHPHALHELGLAYEKEGIPSVIPDPNYARELFTQAAQYGYAPSQFKLGLAYENGFLNCPVDPRRSIAWYSKAAEQGDIEAEFALSGWYLTGAEGVLPQSDTEAYLWARKAADKGSAKAEYAVGYYTETGTGTRQNLEEAKRWYMRAAAQNYRRAMQRLTELKYGGARPQNKRRHTRDANNTSSNSKDSECTIM